MEEDKIVFKLKVSKEALKDIDYLKALFKSDTRTHIIAEALKLFYYVSDETLKGAELMLKYPTFTRKIEIHNNTKK